MNAASFWSVAGLMVLAATGIIVVPLFWLTRHSEATLGARARRWWPAFALAFVVPLAALGIYTAVGEPRLVTTPGSTPAGSGVASLHARTAMQGGQAAGDLGEAVERLRARLAANPDDADGWRLLAQSYEYLGRSAEAADANKHADQVAHAGGTVDFVPEALAAVSGVDPMAGNPAVAAPDARPDVRGSSNELAQRAQEHRRRREFHAANVAFAQLVRNGAMDADLWADYADSLGGEHGGLDAEAERCIASALSLDPRHAKALWLLGSVQTQHGDYRAALATWQKLASILPADSPDARIIAANIAEARAKSHGGGANNSPATPRAAVLNGTVRVDPRWLARVPAGTTLFVFARAADERGPPLAVWRTTSGAWPLSFTLDDSNAMLPDRKLSDFTRVVVEARLSRSGNPLAQPGDLQAVSGVLDPHAQTPVQLTVNSEVGPIAAQGG